MAGSNKYGSFKHAQLVDVKVLQRTGGGNLSTVIAGVEFAVNHFLSSDKKGVLNLSVGAPFNAVLNEIVNVAANAGLAVVVAAGNSNSPACNYSPASAGNAVTVAAIDDRYDSIASFSNWGRCVDISASGTYVVSLNGKTDLTNAVNRRARDSRGQVNGTIALSGTSMSAPIVSGILAHFLSLGDSKQEAINRLFDEATRGAIPRSSMFFRPKTVNLLAFSNLDFDKDDDDDEEEDD